MLRIKKLTPGAGANGASYYTDLASRSLAEYYIGKGEAPGKWIGSGIDDLCIALGVDPVRQGEIMDASGAELFELLNSWEITKQLFPQQRQLAGGGQWTSGYDFTFSAPKGLSILATVTDNDDLRKAIYEAHEEAVMNTMAAIESQICYGREGKNGVRSVQGGGLIGGVFRHRTARPAEVGDTPDPHLHTHVVIANVVRHPDGTWGALDGLAITGRGNRMALAAGAMFAAEQRLALERHGVYLSWKPAGRNGLLEVDGIPDKVLEAFSSRGRQIEEELAKAGLVTTHSHDIAQRRTRERKDKEVASTDDDTLAEIERERLYAVETGEGTTADLATVHAALHNQPAIKRSRLPSLDEIANDLIRPLSEFASQEAEVPTAHLTLQRSTFSYWDIAQAIAQSAPGGATAAEVMAAAKRLIESADIVPLAYASADHERATTPWQQRYTTREILELEQGIIDMAGQGMDARRGVVSSPANITGLSDEQAAMVAHLTGGGHAVAIVEGVAGSGKTYALGRCREAWEAAGWQVVGCAKAAKAASGLSAGSGIQSTTLDSLLISLDSSHGLQAKTVVVVDEASMVGTRELARLAKHVAAAKGKLVLVGDHRQLGAIDAGGVLGHLIQQLPNATASLRENRRNKQEAEALALLREGGDIGEIVADWVTNGRLVFVEDHTSAEVQAVQGWYRDHIEGKDSVMVGYELAHVRALNLLAHARRIEAGEIDQGVFVGDNPLSVGDQVVATRNNRRLPGGGQVLNGERGVITRIDNRGVEIETTDRARKQLSLEYASEHLALGYALTVHKVQGATCDTMHVLGSDNLYREAAYVAASRSRGDTTFYFVGQHAADPEGTTHGHEVEVDKTPEQLVADVMARRGVELAASAYDEQVQNVVSGVMQADEYLAMVREQRWLRTQGILQQGYTAKRAKQLQDISERLTTHERCVGMVAAIAPPEIAVERVGTPPATQEELMQWGQEAGELVLASCRRGAYRSKERRLETVPAIRSERVAEREIGAEMDKKQVQEHMAESQSPVQSGRVTNQAAEGARDAQQAAAREALERVTREAAQRQEQEMELEIGF